MAKNKPNRGASVPPQDTEPIEDELTPEQADGVEDGVFPEVPWADPDLSSEEKEKAYINFNPPVELATATVEADPALEQWDGADSTSSFLIRVDLPYGDKDGTIVDRGHYLSNDPAIVPHLEHLLSAGHAVKVE